MLILPTLLREIGFDAFAGCSSLSRIALSLDLKEIEDEDIFNACDSLMDISFAGSKEQFEFLTHGKTLTVERSDLTVFTPRMTFLKLKGQPQGAEI
jgi:hypothetical protein